MAEKKINWVKVAESQAEIIWQPNNMCTVPAEGKMITLAKYNDKLYAFAQKCPHASGMMADGFLDAMGNVVCPIHRYKFSMENGRNANGEGYYLKIYQVKTGDSGIYVGFEKTSFFNF
ncbi:MAG TPA: Rieske 2Fe-2S domain-containing protein [Sediminibacterium sp.]|nr:Rieske 2Fe-2S domain-containing protein [Sediminibacterium sp.]